MAKFNRGDVSEGILAAAITARFLSKTRRISSADVINVVRNLKSATGSGTKGKTSKTDFQSANENPDVIDTVCCKVNLAEVNMDAFEDLSLYSTKDFKDIVNASVKYANGTYIMQFADLMYSNNQKNYIEVLAEGLLDQTGTKVDLRVRVDGKQVGVGVSLKFGTVKQFGQVGGSSFDSMEALFSPLGVKFNPTFRRKYSEMISNREIGPGLTMAYNEAVRQMNRKNQQVLVRSIADFMKYHATLNEEDVALVQLNKSEAGVYNFSRLASKLQGQEVELEVVEGTTGKLAGYNGGNKIPKMNFILKSTGDILLSIRLKLEGNRTNSKGKRLPLVVRNYIEKGKATTTVLMETA